MAIDARIPLAAGQIESPLLGLARGIQQGQQMSAKAQEMKLRQQEAESAKAAREHAMGLQQQKLDYAEAARQRQMQQDRQQLQRGDLAKIAGAVDTIKAFSADPVERQQYASKLVSDLGLNLPPQAYDSPDDFTDESLDLLAAALPGEASGEKFSATTVNLPGGLTIQTTNTGRKVVTDINGNILQGDAATRALQEAEERELLSAQQKSSMEVTEVADKERVKLREQRSSKFISDITERNRNAARQGRNIREALTLSEQAGEGMSAAVKVKLSKLFPGIDVSDEAALDTALTQLSLEQLQSFKGPTTDYEFNVTQDIVGSISDPKKARKAKLKALERASWFNQREYDQFLEHRRAGGSVDNFKFNFGEQIKTKKGIYTLQDLQDTAVANNLSIKDVLLRLNK